MVFTETLSDEVVVRLQAWETALQDTLTYIAIARNKGEKLYQNAASVPVPNAKIYSELGLSMRKGMFSAAIISFCQIEGKGHEGANIAGNSDRKLQMVRTHLHTKSDEMNQWPSGKTKKEVKEILRERNSYLAHYSGNAAKITRKESSSEGAVVEFPRGSWSGHFTNPWYRPDAFEDFERAVTAMLQEVRLIVSHQTKL